MKWLLRHAICCLITLVCLATATTLGRADTIFSNLGPGETWDQHHSYVILGATGEGSPRPAAPAMPFIATLTATLTTIELPLLWTSGTNGFVVELLTDNKGLPGNAIESFTFTNLPFNGALVTGTSMKHPVLTANTHYWLAAFPEASSTSGAWSLSDPLQHGIPAFSGDGGKTWIPEQFGNTDISAFELDGVPLPKPSAFILSCLVPLILALRQALSLLKGYGSSM